MTRLDGMRLGLYRRYSLLVGGDDALERQDEDGQDYAEEFGGEVVKTLLLRSGVESLQRRSRERRVPLLTPSRPEAPSAATGTAPFGTPAKPPTTWAKLGSCRRVCLGRRMLVIVESQVMLDVSDPGDG